MSYYDDSQPRQYAPSMSRSRGQLASAYAPGAFFTFEGGMGSCLAIPDAGSQQHIIQTSGTVKDQVFARLEESLKEWFERAYQCRQADIKHPIKPELCVDQELLNDERTALREFNHDRFILVDPLWMGYTPAPLTFVCNTCGLFRSFSSIKDFREKKSVMDRECRGRPGRRCQWRQLDVIFVHWSGNWKPVMPGKYDWSKEDHKLRDPINRCPQCHSEDFLLNTASPNIGNWFFKCVNCGAQPDNSGGWIKNDEVTIRALKDEFPIWPAAARMEPVSYRASSAFYAQSEQFVLFATEQSQLLALLDPTKVNSLSGFIAERFGFGRSRPSMEEIERLLKETGHADEWDKYKKEEASVQMTRDLLKNLLNDEKNAANAKNLILKAEKNLAKIADDWFTSSPPILKERNELPQTIRNLIAMRATFSSRYDPFRLLVEHEALTQYKLKAPASDSSRRAFVRFDALDKDLSPIDDDKRKMQESETAKLLQKLGCHTMGLIREFDLCRFTYGYSRVGSSPVVERHNNNMPVKLNFFPTVRAPGGFKHPIYVVMQGNEAIYVRLQEKDVYNWLRKVGPSDMFVWQPEGNQRIGAHIIEKARPFGRYLNLIEPRGDSSTYLYVYTLLHTFSHVIMKAVAEYSGLDLGSLGEYIFPVDLSFVVYRSGTTMDLGNLSALWRNENVRFLKHLLDPKTLICNSGSLCDANPKNPGACPDCILIPETSCIAMNQLLSRAVLRGGHAPREDGDHVDKIPGFFQVVNGTH